MAKFSYKIKHFQCFTVICDHGPNFSFNTEYFPGILMSAKISQP